MPYIAKRHWILVPQLRLETPWCLPRENFFVTTTKARNALIKKHLVMVPQLWIKMSQCLIKNTQFWCHNSGSNVSIKTQVSWLGMQQCLVKKHLVLVLQLWLEMPHLAKRHWILVAHLQLEIPWCPPKKKWFCCSNHGWKCPNVFLKKHLILSFAGLSKWSAAWQLT